MHLTRVQLISLIGATSGILIIWIAGVALLLAPSPAPLAVAVATTTTPHPSLVAATALSVAPRPPTVPPAPTATPYPITPWPTPTNGPTKDPLDPTATPCRADWCQVLGVQEEAVWATPAPEAATLGYGLQIHGCGAPSKAQAIDLISGAGFNWVKQQVRWDEIEGVKGAFAWKCVDGVVRRARAAGLNVLLGINTAPKWARTADGAPDVAAFAQFAGQVAQRYRGQVAAIEIFNEPNLAIEWGPRIDPAGYARLLAAGASAVKRVDPNIKVISAGLAPTRWNDWGAALDDLKFLRAIAGTVAASADCVGVHFNDGRSSPLAAGSSFQQITNDYRTITGKPLCLTEFGIASPLPEHTPPPGFEWSADTTSDEMARWLVEGFHWAQRNPGVYNLIVVWNLNYYSDSEDPNSLYALDAPGGLRPAYLALKAMQK